MKLKIFSLILFLFISTVSSSSDHPLKLTASLIEYDVQEKSFAIECRVFIDDFENTINRHSWDVNNLTEDDIAEIEQYFNQYYRFTHNFTKLSMKYHKSVVFGVNNVLSIEFLIDGVALSEGDDLFIENELFYKQFGVVQSNKMTVRIQPFVKEDFFEANQKQFVIHYKLR
ncbi:MAG: DUF6702 family protein [Bacteroidota bacterium]